LAERVERIATGKKLDLVLTGELGQHRPRARGVTSSMAVNAVSDAHAQRPAQNG
jgi:hypothetical protein